MKKYIVHIIGYVMIFVIIIGLNIKVWNMTRAEAATDPVIYIGPGAVIIISLALTWLDKRR